jgi:GT2 family glycosyltransferase
VKGCKTVKFSFVILNYNTSKETDKCIESIKKLNCLEDEISIIIVDNQSTDESFYSLSRNYKNEESIRVISVEYNVGFSKGNNIGYTVAKHADKSDFIVVLNSDVYIQTKNFIELLKSKYTLDRYDVLGPKILNLNNENQNPVPYIHDTKNKIRLTLIKNAIRYIVYSLPIKIKKTKKIAVDEQSYTEKTNCPLHGSCVVFSKKYIDTHEFAFYPNTFLYGEEDFLYYIAKKEQLKLIYFPELVVIHAEDAASNSINSSFRKQKKFVIKNSGKSLIELYKFMRK